jgi:hypothetical protein
MDATLELPVPGWLGAHALVSRHTRRALRWPHPHRWAQHTVRMHALQYNSFLCVLNECANPVVGHASGVHIRCVRQMGAVHGC